MLTRTQVLTDRITFRVSHPTLPATTSAAGVHQNERKSGSYVFQTRQGSGRFRNTYLIWMLQGKDYVYAGKLNTHTLQVEATAKSAIAANDFSLSLLNKILARVAGDDHAAYISKGFDIVDIHAKPAANGTHDATTTNKPQMTLAQIKQNMTPVVCDDDDNESCEVVEVEANGHKSNIQKEAVNAAAKSAVRHYAATLDADENRYAKMRTMEELAKTLKGDLWSVEYDIPTNCERVSNPSGWLWALACRTTKSVWIMTEKSFNSRNVQDFVTRCKTHGVKTKIRRTHPLDVATELEEIRNALAKHVQDVHTSLIDRLSSASLRLTGMHKVIDQLDANKGLSNDELATLTGEDISIVKQARKIVEENGRVNAMHDQAQRLIDNQNRSLLKAIGEDLAHAVKCAEMFDMTMDMEVLIDGARKALKAEAATFNEQMRERGGKRVNV